LNPVESKITLIDAATEYDFDPIANTNPSNPSIDYDPYYENVGTLEITIEKTSDNSIPSSVQLAIFGCSDSSIIATKAQIEQTTPLTTTGNIFYLREDKSCLPLCLDNAGPLTKKRTTVTKPSTPPTICTNITNLARMVQIFSLASQSIIYQLLMMLLPIHLHSLHYQQQSTLFSIKYVFFLFTCS